MTNDKAIKFEIITPERVVFGEDIYEAILPTTEGQISVFPHHIPLITTIGAGVLSLRRKASEPDSALEHIATMGGFVEVAGNRVRVMADAADRADELNELKIEQAKREAEEALHKAADEKEAAAAAAMLERSLVQLKVVGLKKRHSSRQFTTV